MAFAHDRLSLDRERMRALGYRTVDMLVDWLSDASAPLLERASPAKMRRLLGGPPPEQGETYEEILERLEHDVLRFSSRAHHPGYFAFIPASGTWPGALGDLIASGCNIYAGSWMESPGPSQVELEVLGWFKEWVGYPPEGAGLLVSGGSAANLTALACAREALAGPMSDDLVAYVSDQAHSSVARSARTLGFRPEQVRILPSDHSFRLDPRTVEAAMAADLRAGRRPLLVSANAGATNTGAVDPLGDLADLCRERAVWLHADAAYGGFAVLAERGREQLEGLGRADSVTLDPHKWLYQPFECGCLLVRDGRALRSAFEIAPDYLRDAEAAQGEVNFGDLGLQLTREARALKVWVSLRYFGLEAFRGAIELSLDLAAGARARIEASDVLELVAPPSLGILCFRRRFDGVSGRQELDELHAGLVATLERSGRGLISSTRLRGELALRLCVLNHTTGAEHVDDVLDFLEHAEPERGRGERARPDRHPDVTQSWLGRPEVDSRALRRIPLFRSLSAPEAERVAAMAATAEASRGEVICEQWSGSRDFYVIREGLVEVVADGRSVAEMGPGEFFGELAALDWGAGYGYPRLASVVAASPVRLLVFSSEALNLLIREFPSVEEEIRSALAERLPRRG
jgi:aromatic-L-amino-acid/L-tryptophan decarboxylase